MGIRMVVTIDRTSTEQAWYFTVPHRVEGIVDYIQQNYRNTGLIQKNYFSTSPDQLRQVWVTEFSDQAAYDQYHADPVCTNYFASRDSWHAQNSSVTRTVHALTSTDEPFDMASALITTV